MTEHTCGSCTACCHTVPVPSIGLKSFTRCRHERQLPMHPVGCAIYADRPRDCKLWNCQWLAEKGWRDELRPDRCGVVVDIVPDLILVNGREAAAIQMWVEPGKEDAWHESATVNNLIREIMDLGHLILWRTGRGGKQYGRVFHKDADGRYCYSAEAESVAVIENSHVRAMQLMGGSR